MQEKYKIIGICLSTIQVEDRYYFIEGLNKHAVEAGYRLMIFNSCTDLYEKINANNTGEAQIYRAIPYHLLTAMIVFPRFIWQKEYVDIIVQGCRENDIPLISIDDDIGGRAVFSFDYANTFSELCEHVIKVHGAKRLKLMAGVKGNQFSDERISAFRRVLINNGLDFDDSMVGYGDFWFGPTEMNMKQWFEVEKQPIPDAIICANDSMAITVSSYLQDHGYLVPDDCIVTGFDGILQSEFHIPRLTTAKQDYDHMGRRIVDSINCILSGGEPEKYNIIGFRIRVAGSCGCVPTDSRGINHTVNAIFDRLRLSQERQSLMCTVQSSISKMSDISELPSVLINKFLFATNVFALNDDMLHAPGFGAYHKLERAFSDNMSILLQRYSWNELEPCECSRETFIPRLDLLLEHEEPIIVCAVHFFDLVFGYSVFQLNIDFNEYQKMHTAMSAINSSLGIFHGQVQIKSINSQLTSVNDKLETLSVSDEMTGLLNRRGFYLKLHEQLENADVSDKRVTFISADLDGLKYINDTFGHLEGDNAITTVARGLKACTRASDICARFGGDEFAVCAMITTGSESAYFERFKNNFKKYLENYNAMSGRPYPVEASVGCYSVPLTQDLDLDSLIRNADDLMYADKVARKKKRQ